MKLENTYDMAQKNTAKVIVKSSRDTRDSSHWDHLLNWHQVTVGSSSGLLARVVRNIGKR